MYCFSRNEVERMKKRILGLLIIVLMVGLTAFVLNKFVFFDKDKDTFISNNINVGKTPYAYSGTVGNDIVLYKGMVGNDDDYISSGLYYAKIEDESIIQNNLLIDDFFSSANIYKDDVIYISTENKVKQVNFQNTKSKVLFNNESRSIMEALVVGEDLFLIVETEDNSCNLLSINLTRDEKKVLVNKVNPHYLYYGANKIVVLNENKDLKYEINCSTHTLKQVQLESDEEMVGILDNGEPIYSKDDKIFSLKDSGKREVLVELENIFKIIMHNREMLICTLDRYGLIEVYEYNFYNKLLNKISNANYLPEDFDDKYILCISQEGYGLPELISRESKAVIVLKGNTYVEAATEQTEPESENIEYNDQSEVISDSDKEVDNNSEGIISDDDLAANNISRDEFKNLLEIIKAYYKDNYSWEVIDYRLASRDHTEYKLRTEYDKGNLIVVEVHTGNDPKGPYRCISYGRKSKDKEWEWLNEGY